jgi:pilus assembly protein CpaB
MRAKTILAILFLISLGVAATVVLRSLPQNSEAAAEAGAREEILVARMPLAAGTLLRAPDVAWQAIGRPVERGEIVRPSTAVREAQPKADEDARAEVYGAALRGDVSAGDPIRRDPVVAGNQIRRGVIVKPGDRDFLQIVLSPGARAIAIPVATGGASTGLLNPGDRVDVILTQKFNDSAAPLTHRSVSETVVENLRVLVIDAMDAKVPSGNTFGRTVTLEVMPDQAEKINVATELGKLSLTLRGVGGADGIGAASAFRPEKGVKPTWAGDVSPALGGAMPEKVAPPERPSVEIIRGSKGTESVKTQ